MALDLEPRGREALRLRPLDPESRRSSSSSSCSLAAITSMRPACSASSAVRLTASVTIFAARSPLRPCSSASARTYAAASFSIFRPSTSFVSPGPIEIGVAEPMFVCGAIAATSVASVMNNPAEAARARQGTRRRSPASARR